MSGPWSTTARSSPSTRLGLPLIASLSLARSLAGARATPPQCVVVVSTEEFLHARPRDLSTCRPALPRRPRVIARSPCVGLLARGKLSLDSLRSLPSWGNDSKWRNLLSLRRVDFRVDFASCGAMVTRAGSTYVEGESPLTPPLSSERECVPDSSSEGGRRTQGRFGCASRFPVRRRSSRDSRVSRSAWSEALLAPRVPGSRLERKGTRAHAIFLEGLGRKEPLSFRLGVDALVSRTGCRDERSRSKTYCI